MELLQVVPSDCTIESKRVTLVLIAWQQKAHRLYFRVRRKIIAGTVKFWLFVYFNALYASLDVALSVFTFQIQIENGIGGKLYVFSS